MLNFIYADNVNTTLASPLSSSATSLTLASSANLPTSIPAGMALVITLNDQATRQNFEIIYATSISGATLSGLQRGQENTSAQNWLVGDFAWNGITAGQMRGLSSGRLLSGPTVLTAASGTFTPNPAATLTYVKGCSGGGAGGGAVATGSGQVCIGSGGNAGAYCEFFIAGPISGTVSYTCGQGGTGVVGATGNAGGNSTFGTYATCPGGLGGLVSPAAAPPFFETGNSNGSAPSLSGAAPVLLLPSPSGTAGLAFSPTSVSGGRGNNNPLGVAPGIGYGTGGNGAASFPSSPAQAGTNGEPGAWIVYEYA